MTRNCSTRPPPLTVKTNESIRTLRVVIDTLVEFNVFHQNIFEVPPRIDIMGLSQNYSIQNVMQNTLKFMPPLQPFKQR